MNDYIAVGKTAETPSQKARRATAASLRAGADVSGFMLSSTLSMDFVQFLDPHPNFVIVEMEHSHFDWSEVANCLRMLNLIGVLSIVRIPEIRYEVISRALDAGADGILVPRIRNAGELRKVVNAVRLPPHGGKGIGGYDFQSGNLEVKLRDYNKEKLLLIQVENPEAIANLDEMLATGEVDGAIVGPFDLSQSLGIPGLFTDDRFSDAVNSVLDSCARARVAAGALMPSATLAAEWRQSGMTISWIGTETSIFLAGYSKTREEYFGEET